MVPRNQSTITRQSSSDTESMMSLQRRNHDSTGISYLPRSITEKGEGVYMVFIHKYQLNTYIFCHEHTREVEARVSHYCYIYLPGRQDVDCAEYFMKAQWENVGTPNGSTYDVSLLGEEEIFP